MEQMSSPLRVCVQCGQPFDGANEQRMCPDCRSATRAATVLRSRTCRNCGAFFQGGPRAVYCPSCRSERRKAHSREYKHRKRANRTRTLGSTDYCVLCGKSYTVMGGLQRYCPDCAPVAIRETVNTHKREYAKDRLELATARKAELTAQREVVCTHCGKTFHPRGQERYCSPECRQTARRERRRNDAK